MADDLRTRDSSVPSQPENPPEDPGQVSGPEWVALIQAEQRQCWRRGTHLPLEAFLARTPARPVDDRWLLELVYSEINLRQEEHAPATLQEYVQRFPHFAQRLERFFALREQLTAEPAIAPESVDPLAGPPADALATAAFPAAPEAPTLEKNGSKALRADPAHSSVWTEVSEERSPTVGGEDQGRPRSTDFAFADQGNYARPVQPTIPGYEIQCELGRGGMGVVYLVWQPALKRTAALKMVLSRAHAGRHELGRFHTEAEAAARLQHPNITQIYEIGEHEGMPYFTLEYVDGGSLAQKITSGNTLPEREAAQLVEKLARAMHHAHQRGIVHRDLKPANILLTAEGEPKITDFGLAKLFLEAEQGYTRTGDILGTPSFMAPEQAAGKTREITPATDVYALGAILYDLITGRPPFKAESAMETLAQVVQREPVPPSRLQPGISRDLETICLKCLEKEQHKRYVSAEALAEDLHHYLANEPIHARPSGVWTRSVKWARRRPAVAALWTLTAAFVLSGIGFIVYHNRDLATKLTAAVNATLEEQARVTALQQSLKEAQAAQRLAAQQTESEAVLKTGDLALQGRDWHQAKERAATVLASIRAEPGLKDLQSEAERIARQAESALQAETDFQRFLQLRDRAQFALHRNAITGVDLPDDVAAARNEASTALNLLGVTADGRDLPKVPDSFTEKQREQWTRGCYEILLLYADALSRSVPGQKAEEKKAQLQQALKVLDHADAILPKTQASQLRRAQYLTSLGDPAGARLRADLGNPQPATALDAWLVGSEAMLAGRTQEAMPQLERAVQLQPDLFWAHYFLAVGHLRMQQPAAAKARLVVCASQKPDFPGTYLLRGLIEGQHNPESSAGFEDLDKARALNHAPGAVADPVIDYIALVNRGVLHEQRRQYGLARAAFDAAIRLQPQSYSAYANRAQVLRSEAFGLSAFACFVVSQNCPLWTVPASVARRQLLGEAGRDLDTAVRLAKGLPQVTAALLRERAFVHLEQLNTPAAIQNLQESLKQNSTGDLAADVYCMLGRLALAGGDAQEAWEDATRARALKRNSAAAALLAGYAAMNLGHYADAIQAFDAFLRVGTASAEVYQARAEAKSHLRDYSGFLDDATAAVALQPTSVGYTFRGWAYAAAQSWKLAQADFRRAIELDPGNADAIAGLGFVHASRGETKLAVEEADRALQLPSRSTLVPYRMRYKVARIYAVLAGRETLTGANRQRLVHEQKALELLEQSILLQPAAERSSFLSNVIAHDPVMQILRTNPRYVRLVHDLDRVSR